MHSYLGPRLLPRGAEVEIGDLCLPVFAQHDIDTNTARSGQFKSQPYATEEVWEPMRDTITRLYQSEGRPLQDVKRIMERDYRFHATQRMFKTRIVRWGLHKKLKEEEVMYMLKLKRQRLAAGKDSSFRIRDQDIDWDRVEQYLKRRPDLEHKKYPSSRSTLGLDITCRTPSPIPDPCVPYLLEPTLDIDIQEDTMRIFEKYHIKAFETDIWVLDHKNLCEHGFVYVLQTLSNIGKMPKLLKLNQAEAGSSTLREGLKSLRYILQTRDSRFYYALLVNVLNLKGDFGEYAIRFVHQMHQETLGDQHELSLFWSKIKVLPQENRLEALRAIFVIIYKRVEGRAASQIQHVLDVLRMRCALLKLLNDVNGTEFRTIISSHKAAAENLLEQGRYALSCRAYLGLAIAQLDADEYEQAKETLAQIESIIRTRPSGSSKEQWLEKQHEDHCSMSTLCPRKKPYEKSIRYAKMVYGYYKGHWEPWSRWSSAAAGMIIHAHRQAKAEDVGDSRVWFDVLHAISS